MIQHMPTYIAEPRLSNVTQCIDIKNAPTWATDPVEINKIHHWTVFYKKHNGVGSSKGDSDGAKRDDLCNVLIVSDVIPSLI